MPCVLHYKAVIFLDYSMWETDCIHAMLIGISLKFFESNIGQSKFDSVLHKEMMMFHMHDLLLVELDCQYRVTHTAGLQHRPIMPL